MTAVSMGNPHAVIYVGDVGRLSRSRRSGPLLEHHPAFPRGSTSTSSRCMGPGEVPMRTWERGTGITLACGTGACAVCVAGVLTGRTERTILAHLPGGDLELEWPDDNASGLHDRPGHRGLLGRMAGLNRLCTRWASRRDGQSYGRSFPA